MRSTILIICLVALLSAIIPPVSATTWYVDDSGGVDFTAIQDAVNAASPGDTVRVRDGTYRENLLIDRQVTLEAVNRGMVRIVVSAAAQVTADGVTIRGIVIRGSDEIPRVRPWQDLSLTSVNDCTIEGCEFWDGGIVLSNCRNCTVRDSIFTETYRAVDLEGSHGNLIEGNLISWNRDYAIYSESSSDNRIIRNRMYGAEGGGTIDLWNSHNNTIAENVLDGYDPFGAQSLCLHTGSSGNIIYLNDFLNSNYPTLFSEAGSNVWNATTPVTYTWNDRTLTGYPGNYWQVPDGSGYSGSDDDGNGLGDTPYTLRKSTESDCHPLMAPVAGYLPEEETAPTWIVVSPATPTIVAGETRPFLARYSDQHGVRLYDLPVVWSCDNPAVGTIDDDGLFTAAGPGTATVTAAVGGLAASAHVTVVGQTPAEGNATIVVDQSGSGDYTTIGAAVAAAGAGDRIVVHPGTYTEAVQVTAPVSIAGTSGAKSTIVKAPDSGSPCVSVFSGGVSMTGLTFSGGRLAPAVLVRGVSGGRIADVVAREGYEGIRLDDCSGILIENLTVPGRTDGVTETHLGVVLVNGSSGNRIEGCTMRTKEYAVWIEDGTGNSVTGSMLYGRARGGSVALFRSDENTVTGNDLDCPHMGLHGVFLWQSANNRIWFNNFLEGHIHTFSTESRNFWVSETPVSYSFDGKEYTGQLGNYWEVVAGYPDNGYAGSDGDGDGIGDTTYAVPHCDSGDVDARPLVQQTGGYTPAPPAADFTANVTSGEAPLAVAFTDASLGAASWSWEFGDGATSARQNPVHTFGKAGNYTVNLTASSEYGMSSAQIGITVTKPAPIVFNTSVMVYADEPIVVDNTTYGGTTFFNILAAAGYIYTYGDSDAGYSDRKPLLTLTMDGVTYPTKDFGDDYKWKFYETIGTGDDYKYKKGLNGYISESGTYYIWYGDMSQFSGWDLPAVNNSIYVVELTVDLQPTRSGAAPVAEFVANVTSGEIPLAVAFTDQSTGASSWSWEFGDCATSAEQHPVHTYTAPGTYTVTLTVANAAGSDSATKTITVTESGGEEASVLTLHSGWNFVSTPKRLAAGANTFAIFNGVDTAGRTILLYDGQDCDWKAMSPTDTFRPLDAVWIYANESYTIPLSFAFGGPELPPTKDLGKGWNAIGFSDTAPEAAAPTLLSLGDHWATLIGFNAETQGYEDAIIRTPEGTTQKMQPMQGYWIYMTRAETLAAISV